MIELQARVSELYDWHTLELSESAAIPLTYSFADPNKLMSREAPYSGTFLLPFSNINNDFFENYFMIDLSQGPWSNDIFSPENPVQCTLLNDGISLIEGVLQLISVSKTGQTYECAITGGAGDLFTQMGTTKLKDIFSNSANYKFLMTGANVKESWESSGDITDGNVGAGVVRIPIVDKALSAGGRLFGNSESGQGVFAPYYIQPMHLIPWMNIDHIFRKILSYFGFSLQSAFMSTTVWTNLYMSLANGANGVKAIPHYGFKVGLLSDMAAFSSGYTSVAIPFDVSTGALFYDPDDHWNETTHIFTVPNDMNLVLDLGLGFNNSAVTDPSGSLSEGRYMTVVIVAGPAAIFSQQVYIPNNSVDITSYPPWAATMQEPINVFAGQEIQLIVSGNIEGVQIVANSVRTFFRWLSYESTSLSNTECDTIDNLPDITCSSFVKDLVQRYNLTLLPSTSPQELILEPLSDYIASGDVLDWTEKLDRSQPFVVKPATSLRKKNIIFNDGADADWPNQWHMEEYGYPLGQYSFTSQDTYATGSAQNTSVFGNLAIQTLPTADWNGSAHPELIYPRLFGESNGAQVPVAHKPKIAYFNGKQSLNLSNYSLYIDTTAISEYGCITPFHTLPITDTTQTTLWRQTHKQGSTSPLIGQQYAQGLVQSYWSKYLGQLYSPDARLVMCQIALTPADMNRLTFDDRIFIDGIYYRVIEISGYNPVNPKPTAVRLLKLIDIGSVTLYPSDDCDLTYISSNIDGTTNWIDADGVAQDPNTACCEAQGLTYHLDGVTPACWWDWQTDGPTVDPTGTSGGDTDGDGSSGFSGAGASVSGIPSRSFFPDTPIPIGAQQGTHLFRQSSRNFSMPTAMNGTAAYSRNAENIGNSSIMEFQLLCVTNNTSAVTAGIEGSTTSELVMRENSIAHFKINALGVIYAAATASVGGTYFVSQSIVVKSFDGVISIVASTTDESSRDAGLAAPTVAITPSGVLGVLDLSVTGEDDINTSWVMDVNVAYMNIGGLAEMENNGIMTEANDFFILENSTKLVTEQT